LTQKMHTRLTLTALLLALVFPILASLISNGTLRFWDAKSKRIDCIEKQVQKNSQDIQTIQDTQLSPAELQALLKANNSELIRELFEKGYIRAREK
jgi:cytoskeletal protein RodZ